MLFCVPQSQSMKLPFWLKAFPWFFFSSSRTTFSYFSHFLIQYTQRHNEIILAQSFKIFLFPQNVLSCFSLSLPLFHKQSHHRWIFFSLHRLWIWSFAFPASDEFYLNKNFVPESGTESERERKKIQVEYLLWLWFNKQQCRDRRKRRTCDWSKLNSKGEEKNENWNQLLSAELNKALEYKNEVQNVQVLFCTIAKYIKKFCHWHNFRFIFILDCKLFMFWARTSSLFIFWCRTSFIAKLDFHFTIFAPTICSLACCDAILNEG